MFYFAYAYDLLKQAIIIDIFSYRPVNCNLLSMSAITLSFVTVLILQLSTITLKR